MRRGTKWAYQWVPHASAEAIGRQEARAEDDLPLARTSIAQSQETAEQEARRANRAEELEEMKAAARSNREAVLKRKLEARPQVPGA